MKTAVIVSKKEKRLREWVRPLAAIRLSPKNAACSLSEFAVLPLIHLAATPFLIGHLGLDLYGIWMLIISIVGLVGSIDLGLGEATIRFISLYRGRGDHSAVLRTVRTAFGLSCLLAVGLGIILLCSVSLLVDRAFLIPNELRAVALQSFQIGVVLVAIRMVESIFIGTFRGFERYDVAATASIGIRAATLCSAVVMALLNFGLPAILAGSAALSAMGLLVEGVVARGLMEASPWALSLSRSEFQKMFAFGGYAWLHGTAWSIFSQADRVIIGAFLGTSALGVYSICMQLAQPIHGMVGAGFSTVFPAMSRSVESQDRNGLIHDVQYLIRLNIAGAVLLTMPVIYFSETILTWWMGWDFMVQANTIFRLLVAGSFVQATGVVPYFLLLGAGDAKFVSMTSVAGTAAMLLGTLGLIPFAGIYAPAAGRLLGAAVAYANFARLIRFVKQDDRIPCGPCVGQEAQSCAR